MAQTRKASLREGVKILPATDGSPRKAGDPQMRLESTYIVV